MVAGWPIAHHVWAGNTRDSKTVPEVVADLSKRFAFRQVVFVGDRGMVTEKNLQVLEKAEGDWGFLVGMTGARIRRQKHSLIVWTKRSGSTARRVSLRKRKRNRRGPAFKRCLAIVRGCGCSWLTATSGGPTSNECARR